MSFRDAATQMKTTVHNRNNCKLNFHDPSQKGPKTLCGFCLIKQGTIEETLLENPLVPQVVAILVLAWSIRATTEYRNYLLFWLLIFEVFNMCNFCFRYTEGLSFSLLKGKPRTLGRSLQV